MRTTGFSVIWYFVSIATVAGLATGLERAWGTEPETPKADRPATRTVEDLTKSSRASIVTITVQGRDGKLQGLGTGFVVSAEGLIATNLHVIGESRPISAQLPDGRTLAVQSIHASDRELDLALLQVDARDLVPLPLGESAKVQDGEAIVALGNPRGLRNSVVAGLVSGHREVEGRKMLQLAIPIESGNSGGPVLDMQGRVIGVVTMKSLVTNNLGFAVEIDQLKRLLDRPNPIPMSRWLLLGTLDPDEWTTLLGAQWQQRGGIISVKGGGDAFGRSLCLRQSVDLPLPFELAVQVKLDDESGAAGLVFHADGGEKHYGFYPTNGKLRFTRFDGPVVQEWNVLREIPATHYRPGEWNRLKVRIEAGKFICFVNDREVLQISDDRYQSGKVGLVKFRQTEAEFRRFEAAPSIAVAPSPVENRLKVQQIVDGIPALDSILVPQVMELQQSIGTGAADLLRRQADAMQRKATELRQLAGDLQTSVVIKEIEKMHADQGEEIDLLRGSLLIAKLDDADLDIADYVRQVERMAAEIRRGLAEDATPQARLASLDKYLFQENGFHGSRFEYYHRANSYLQRVIDDREGLPLTLSILYMELAQRLGVAIEGIPVPGHFLVRRVDAERPESGDFIDVFEGGKRLTRTDVLRKAAEVVGERDAESSLHPATKRQMLQRMLANLAGNAEREKDAEALLRYYDAMVALDPQTAKTRFDRARLRFQTGRNEQAIAELEWFLENRQPSVSEEGIRAIQEEIRKNKRPVDR